MKCKWSAIIHYFFFYSLNFKKDRMMFVSTYATKWKPIQHIIPTTLQGSNNIAVTLKMLHFFNLI